MLPDTFVTFAPDRQDTSWGAGWDPTVELRQPATFRDLPQTVFLWYYFHVTVTFRIGGVDLSQSMDVAPVSLLDFVLMLQAAARTVGQHEGSAENGLSDRDDRWQFSRYDDLVSVRCILSRVEGWCPVREFQRLADICLSDALRLLFWEQPALRENTYLLTLTRPAAGRKPLGS